MAAQLKRSRERPTISHVEKRMNRYSVDIEPKRLTFSKYFATAAISSLSLLPSSFQIVEYLGIHHPGLILRG
jgi:hypothetical protein